MQEVHSGNFGLAIAYLLPGFVVVVGVSFFLRSVRAWLSPEAAQSPTVGGFLYVTLASLAAGMTVSAVRWAVIDTVHKWTGLRRPDWNYHALHERIKAYEFLVGNLYRYYQFYSLWRALHKEYYADVDIMRSCSARHCQCYTESTTQVGIIGTSQAVQELE